MEALNTPEYRAQNVNGIESHIGLLKWNKNKTKYWINDFESGSQEVDPTTLAIHFPGMVDSKGTNVFASLSLDGKGGDMFDAEPAPEDESCIASIIFINGCRTLYKEWDCTLPYPRLDYRELKNIKVVGVSK